MLNINYDKEFDVLYISFGKPKPSYGEEDASGIVIRKDMNTDEITGVTIFYFMKRIKENSLSDIHFPKKINLAQIISASCQQVSKCPKYKRCGVIT